jgi:CRP/FNR family cyclic AMP-dependent transcriptional regulator
MTPGDSKLLRSLPADTQRELLLGASNHQFTAGEQIPGGAPGSAYTGIVSSGLVRTYLEEGERQQTIRYLGAGRLLGAAQFYGRPVPQAQCITDVRFVRLEPDAVRQLMRVNCGVAMAVADELVDDFDAATQELALTSFHGIRERVAHQLLLRALVVGPILDITQRDIARTVGSVREVVGRTMQEFERRGAVRRLQDGNLELDLDALEEIRASRRTR